MIFSVEMILSSCFLLATSSISHLVNGDRNKRKRRITYWTHGSSVFKRFRVHASCLPHSRFLILSMETRARESVKLAMELNDLQCWKDFEFRFLLATSSISHFVIGDRNKRKRRISNGTHWFHWWKDFEFMFLPYHILDFSFCH